MLRIISRVSESDISALKTVYLQSIMRLGDDFYYRFPAAERMYLAEERFVDDLRDFFIATRGKLFLLCVDEKPVSALRAEPYLDGSLFSYLETTPEMRGRGYARMLISSVIAYLQSRGVYHFYSHVHKKNAPSLAAHRATGFRISADHAKLLDGTVTQNYYTLHYNSTAE